MHILSAIDAKIVDCFYINDKTDSVALNCKSGYSYITRLAYFESIEQDSVPFYEENTSIRDGECYSDLFKSELKEKNSLNVKLLKTSNYCDTGDALIYQFSNIHELDISSNSRHYLMRLQFKSLTKLNASHNNFVTLDFTFLNFVQNLIELDLSYNEIQSIFGNITDQNIKLAIINLSHNELKYLEEDKFYGLTNLKELDLSYNRIYFIQAHTFKFNQNLEVLRLSNNPLLGFDCHYFSSVKQLASVTVTFDRIEQLALNCMDCTIDFASDNSDEMIIQSAKIKNPLRYKKENFKNLIFFAMSENEMKNISQIIELLPLSLKLLEIGSSKLNQQNINIIERFNQLDLLHLTHSNLTELEPKMFSNKTKLRILNLSFNRLKIRDPKAVFAPLENIQTFLIANAHLENTPDVVHALPSSIIQLDLSVNNLGKIDATTFQHLINLQFLNLSHTNLSNFGFNTFYHQTKLTWLDLSYNNLMKVDFTLFIRSFLNLTHLYLEGNNLSEIKTITPTVFPMLTTLATSKNQLSCHDLVAFFHQWKNLKIIENPSNQTHMIGIDCNLHLNSNADEEAVKMTEMANGVHISTPSKQEIIITHNESRITKYSVLFLCVICCGYLVLKSELIQRIKSKLSSNSLANSERCQPATSTLVLLEQENL